MLPNIGLLKEDAVVRIEAAGEQRGRHGERIGSEVGSGGRVGDGVKVDDAEDVETVAVLNLAGLDPSFDGSEVVTQMEATPGGLDPGEDP